MSILAHPSILFGIAGLAGLALLAIAYLVVARFEDDS